MAVLERRVGKAGFLVEEPPELSFTEALGTGQEGGSGGMKGVLDREGSLNGKPMVWRYQGATAQAGPHDAVSAMSSWGLPSY